MENGCSDKANRHIDEDKSGGNKVSVGRCCSFLHCKISYHLFTAMPLQQGEKEVAVGTNGCSRRDEKAQGTSTLTRLWGERVSADCAVKFFVRK